ncbi:MAG: L,D-transpeptidase family protein [Chloroflexota bacterium]
MLTRRDFLKLSGAGLLTALFAGVLPDLGQAAPVPRLGRVAWARLPIRESPSLHAPQVGTVFRDTVLDVAEGVYAGSPEDYNRLWYRLNNGDFVYSGGVQPVREQPNLPVSSLEQPTVGEVTVPFSDTYRGINHTPSAGRRVYYATTHWILETVTDRRDGQIWYKAYDYVYRSLYYLPAEHVRILPAEELTLTSPDIPTDDKTIEVRLPEQLVLAYEAEHLVFVARVATGQGYHATPSGLFRTFHKRPTARMSGGDGVSSSYDLLGVPWDTYITENGVAFHGTFWHNDFGAPRSHGCINMTPDSARWIYRWTLPVVPVAEPYLYRPGTGTTVRII